MGDGAFVDAMNSGDRQRIAGALRERFGAPKPSIRYALAAIKGVGDDAACAIVEARKAGGEFRSLEDFALRVDMTRVNKRALEALVKAGAFDCIEANRASVLASVEDMTEIAKRKRQNPHQQSLF